MRKVFAICGGSAETCSSLALLGFCVLETIPAQGLPEETSRHPDMLMCVADEKTIFVHESQKGIIDELCTAGVNVSPVSHSFGEYPLDVAFNIALTKSLAVGRLDALHPDIACKLTQKKLSVRQGYAKCSSCFVGENGIITEDSTIAQAFRSQGFDVLEISKGDVFLSENHYGFFGGATGSPDNKTLFVNGELRFHRDEKAIRSFLEKHGVTAVEIAKGRITDIGSLLFV